MLFHVIITVLAKIPHSQVLLIILPFSTLVPHYNNHRKSLRSPKHRFRNVFFTVVQMAEWYRQVVAFV